MECTFPQMFKMKQYLRGSSSFQWASLSPWLHVFYPAQPARGALLQRPEKPHLSREGQLGFFLGTPECLPDSPPCSQELVHVLGSGGPHSPVPGRQPRCHHQNIAGLLSWQEWQEPAWLSASRLGRQFKRSKYNQTLLYDLSSILPQLTENPPG